MEALVPRNIVPLVVAVADIHARSKAFIARLALHTRLLSQTAVLVEQSMATVQEAALLGLQFKPPIMPRVGMVARQPLVAMAVPVEAAVAQIIPQSLATEVRMVQTVEMEHIRAAPAKAQLRVNLERRLANCTPEAVPERHALQQMV